MVTELAVVDILAGHEDEFVKAVERNTAAIKQVAQSVHLLRCLEEPARFVLQVEWDDIAAHEAFKTTEAFARWRADVGPHLAAPPAAAHYRSATGAVDDAP